MDGVAGQLALTWTDAWLIVVTAVGMYGAIIGFSRVFGQRQFMRSSTYDLAFVFAVGSIIGRVLLVRTSLGAAALALLAMFVLHAVFGWAHHNITWVHRLIQNPPVLVVVDGAIHPEGLRAARMSATELHQMLRLQGQASLDGVRAAILERNGSISLLQDGTRIDPQFVEEVRFGEALHAPG